MKEKVVYIKSCRECPHFELEHSNLYYFSSQSTCKLLHEYVDIIEVDIHKDCPLEDKE